MPDKIDGTYDFPILILRTHQDAVGPLRTLDNVGNIFFVTCSVFMVGKSV